MFYRHLVYLALVLLSRWVCADNIPPPAERFFNSLPEEIFLLSEDGQYIATQTRGGSGNGLSIGLSDNLEQTNVAVLKDRESIVCSFWYSGNRLGYYAKGQNDAHIFGLVDVLHLSLTGRVEIKQVCRFTRSASSIAVLGPRSRKDLYAGMVVSCAFKDEELGHLFEINLETNKWQELKTESLGVIQWTTSKSGKKLAGIRSLRGRKELIILSPGHVNILLSCLLEETATPVGFDKNDKVLWVVSNRGSSVDKTRLEEWDLETGRLTRVLHTDPQHEVDLAFPVIDRGGEQVLGVYYNRDRLQFHSMGNRTDDIMHAIASTSLQGDDYILSDSDCFGRRWIVVHASDAAPSKSLLYNCETKKWLNLSRNSELKTAQPHGQMRPFRFKARDDVELNGYITASPDSGIVPQPTVLFVHGGPRVRNRWGYDPRVQFLASRGYVVAQVNFRGSEGFGKSFANAGNRQMGTGVMQDDISDAVKYLVAKGITDSKRVAIFGGSYGGYSALAGMTFTPDLFAAGIDFFGLSDLESYLRELQPTWKPIEEDFKLRIGDPMEPNGVNTLRQQSPLYAVDYLKSPLLLVHGDQDRIVPTAQSDTFVTEARRQGKQVDYLVFKGGHGFSEDKDEATAFIAIERFLHKHLRGLIGNNDKADLSAKIDAWRNAAEERLNSKATQDDSSMRK